MEKRILEIKERLKNATPGEWTAWGIPYNGINDPNISTKDGVYIAQTVYDMQSGTQEHNIDADTVFIAHAKQDIEYLLKKIENTGRSVENGRSI